jgi:hypothetical protein
MEITQWSARVTVPADDGIAAAMLTAELDLGSLTVRAGTGGAKPLTDRDRRDIKASARKILGATAAATFTSSRVIPSSTAPPAGGPSSAAPSAGGTIEEGGCGTRESRTR